MRLGFDDLLGLFAHYLLLGLISIGGAITTVPDMHRYLVTEHHWMTDAQFTASVALAQAAPGPNLLFVAVMGWTVAGAIGTLTTMLGILIPSTALTLGATRWGARNRETRAVRSFTTGLAPITVGLLFSTGWVLSLPYLTNPAHRVGAAALIALTVATMLRTRLSPMWLIALGFGAGALGWV